MKKWKNSILILIALITCTLLTMIYLNFLNSKKHTIKIDNTDREYLIHYPPNYKSGDNLPLVIALHGYTDSPRLMEFYSGLSRKSDKEGFIVVYPYGTKSQEDKNLSWNGGSCCGSGVLDGVDDVKFINSLTDTLVKDNKIDPKKVFVAGFSNGALLTYRLASETPERYKAFAVVSGAIGGKVYKNLPQFVIKKPGKPVSLLMMHGLMDTRIPYSGGENQAKNGDFKSVSEAKELFKESNNCTGTSLKESEKYTNEIFSCKEAKFELFTIKKAGHVWPGSLLDYKNVLKRNSTPATDLIWNFFKEVN